jgi:hypothetical protein
MARSLSIARSIALLTPIVLPATGCTYERQHSDAAYYGAYVYRADYQSGYHADEDTKAPRMKTTPSKSLARDH